MVILKDVTHGILPVVGATSPLDVLTDLASRVAMEIIGIIAGVLAVALAAAAGVVFAVLPVVLVGAGLLVMLRGFRRKGSKR